MKKSFPEIEMIDIWHELGFQVQTDQKGIEYEGTVIYRNFRSNRYLIDFALPYAKIAIETDGRYWHGYSSKLSPQQAIQRIKDAEKNEYLLKQGWHVFRFSDTVLKKRDWFKQTLWHCILSVIDV